MCTSFSGPLHMVTSPKEHAAARQPLHLHIIISLSCDSLGTRPRPLPSLVRPSAPLCGPRRLLAGLAAFVQPSLPPCGRCRPLCGRCRPLCGLRRLHAVLAAFMRSFHLTSTPWLWPSVSCRGRFSRPSSQDAGRSFSPACTFVKMQTGGGSCRGSFSR